MTMTQENIIDRNEQLSILKDNYAELIVDGLDHKDMYRIVFDYLRSEIESANEEELKEEICDMYGEDIWKELSQPAL